MYLGDFISVKAYIILMTRAARPFDLPRLFAALSDRTRLRLLNLMDGREVCVCYFVEILDQIQPKISRHLAYLRRAGIVSARREGKWMHYRIEQPRDPGAAAILAATLRTFKSDPAMRADSAKLARACCQPAGFVTLQGAPVPTSFPATVNLEHPNSEGYGLQPVHHRKY
jgi:ArsR family transcriptional regulator